ncbi:MAG: methyltransferase domain-containing protein [Phycisphaerales bacterium]
MSLGLGHGKPLDPAEGVVGVAPDAIPPLPDDLLTNPEAARLDPGAWFEHPERPFEIEIGPGKGSFLLAHAADEPETNVLGIEWASEIYRYAADRVRRHRKSTGTLLNVRMLKADATSFVKWRLPDAIVRTIHLYYSDPWPKKKHHKNRVVQHGFLREAWRVLIPGGQLRVVTDHDDLWVWDRAHFDAWTSAESAVAEREGLPSPPFVEQPFDRPEWATEGTLLGTNYEKKFTGEHHQPHAAVLIKQA